MLIAALWSRSNSRPQSHDVQAVAQCLIGVDLAAVTACFAAGEPAVDHGQFAAIPGCFVLQLAFELVKSDISDSLGQVVILHHPSNIQILDRNEWFGFRQLTGDLMECVATDVCHVGVRPGQSGYGFAAVCAAFLATRNGALQSFCFLEGVLEGAGVGILRAI